MEDAYSPERWQQLNDALDAVIERAPDERAAYLARHYPGDTELHTTVERLAAAYDASESFLEQPVAGQAAALWAAAPEPEGRRLGAYRLCHALGHGGMGTVYLAERADEAFEQQVAVKLIRRGLDTPEAVERFRGERQILARLQHPHIARLLDGGVADEGRPYFVMEYVEGVPLDQYCDAHRLSLDARLALFLDVCDAVAYAHRNLIVHRDLKPSNILVTEEGAVKLLDFGIAKVLSEDDDAGLTRTGMRVMTPEYAAPEQIRAEAITTATDVYALGVLLYALLSGCPPYHLHGRSTHDIERTILETEPRRPSTALVAEDGDSGAPEAISHARGTSVAALRRRLRGDLDTIVLKALKKEPERRYPSAEALAEDVRRYRAGLPVLARPDTLGYRLGKFARRHRYGVAAAFLFVMLVLAYAVTVELQARRLAVERDKATQVSAFLVDLFNVSDPNQARGDSLLVQDVLAAGAARLEEDLAGQPEVQAQMMTVVGEVYQNLGLYDDALGLFEQALAVRRARWGDTHPDVAASLDDVAWVRHLQGELDAAEGGLQDALALRRQVLGAGHIDVSESMCNLATVLQEQGRLDEAEPLLRAGLAIRRAQLGDDHPLVDKALYDLALLEYYRGRYAEAEPLYREVLALRRARYGDAHLDVAHVAIALGLLLHRTDALEEAEALTREGLATYRQLLGEAHSYVATALNNLSLIESAQGDLGGAIGAAEAAMEVYRATLGEAHPYVRLALNNTASLLRRNDQLGEAETMLRAALGLWNTHEPDADHAYRAATFDNLGRVLRGQERFTEAEAFQEQGLAMWRRLYGEAHPRVANSLYFLGQLHEASGDTTEAAARYREALAMARDLLGPEHRTTTRIEAALQALTSGDERPSADLR